MEPQQPEALEFQHGATSEESVLRGDFQRGHCIRDQLSGQTRRIVHYSNAKCRAIRDQSMETVMSRDRNVERRQVVRS